MRAILIAWYAVQAAAVAAAVLRVIVEACHHPKQEPHPWK